MEHMPIIILGMHRSGTSLLARILEKFGLFLGYKKDPNNEAIFFLHLNEWMLKQANAGWDNPYCFKFSDNFLLDSMRQALEHMMVSKYRVNYLGPALISKYNDIRSLEIPWGWKDPRNTFTIDVWKKIFPNAKIIHVYRNPIDVAESLRMREKKWQQEMKRLLRSSGYGQVINNGIKLQQSARLGHIQEGVALWREYIDKAFSLRDENTSHMMHVRYEDLLSSPENILLEIVRFIGLKVRQQQITQCAKHIDVRRRYAFTGSKELVELYMSLKSDERMKLLRYDKIYETGLD